MNGLFRLVYFHKKLIGKLTLGVFVAFLILFLFNNFQQKEDLVSPSFSELSFKLEARLYFINNDYNASAFNQLTIRDYSSSKDIDSKIYSLSLYLKYSLSCSNHRVNKYYTYQTIRQDDETIA